MQLVEFAVEQVVVADVQLDQAFQVADAVDIDMLAPVAEYAYQNNIPQEQLNGLMDTYLQQADQLVETMSQQDNIDAQEATKLLKENWGKDYTVNMNRITNRMNMLPEDIREQVKEARMPDGRGLMNSPEFMTWMVSMDREIMPLDPIPGGGEADVSTAQSIIGKVQKIWDEGREKEDYWGNKNTGLREEYEKALAFMDKVQGSQ